VPWGHHAAVRAAGLGAAAMAPGLVLAGVQDCVAAVLAPVANQAVAAAIQSCREEQ